MASHGSPSLKKSRSIYLQTAKRKSFSIFIYFHFIYRLKFFIRVGRQMLNFQGYLNNFFFFPNLKNKNSQSPEPECNII